MFFLFFYTTLKAEIALAFCRLARVATTASNKVFFDAIPNFGNGLKGEDVRTLSDHVLWYSPTNR